MDERTSRAAVAIHKRVDGFELGMSHRCLGYRWKRVGVAEGAEVLEKRFDIFLWGRNKRR